VRALWIHCRARKGSSRKEADDKFGGFVKV
jgi:hypothetical protein